MWRNTNGLQAEIHKYWIKFKCICYKSNLVHCMDLFYAYMLVSVKRFCISKREMKKFSMNSLFWLWKWCVQAKCFFLQSRNYKSKQGPFVLIQQRKRITALIITSLPIKRPILLSTAHTEKKGSETWVVSHIMCVYIRIRYAYIHMRWRFPDEPALIICLQITHPPLLLPIATY